MIDRFRDDSRIVHVSGECYRRKPPGEESYFFSKYPLAWGWATWRRAWSLFDARLSSWPQFRAQLAGRELFDSDDERHYWISTFDVIHREQSSGRMVSWDYAWYYACMTHGLSIHPAVNLVTRLEGLCKPLGHNVLVSAAVAAETATPLVPLGEHALRGIATPCAVFALPDG